MATLLADLVELEADHLEIVVPTATDLGEAGLENITMEGQQGRSQLVPIPALFTTFCECGSPCCTCPHSCGAGCTCGGGHLTQVMPGKPTAR
jgi:hypothetical protein